MTRSVIAVVGEMGEDTLNLHFLKGNTVIASGKQSLQQLTADVNYLCVNKDADLDHIMKDSEQTALVLAPKNLYARYVFYKGIECLPDFVELEKYQWNSLTVSQQLAGLALSLWVGSPVVALFNYLLEPSKETPALEAMFKLYPNTKFFYVREKNKNRIKWFERYKNAEQMNLIEFQEFYEKYKSSN